MGVGEDIRTLKEAIMVLCRSGGLSEVKSTAVKPMHPSRKQSPDVRKTVE